VPIYEYRCGGCGRIYEEWTGKGAAAPPACPECGHEGRERVPSRFAISVATGPERAKGTGPARACAGGGPCGCGAD
jgi:putative FmdB family regulatory protein